jgi:RHS repeat-associated protein
VASCDAASRSYRTCLDYDSFHRLGRQSTPKSTKLRPGLLLWSNADYDPNDNVITEVGPHEGASNTKQGATTTARYDDMDRIRAEIGPDRTVDPDGEETTYAYDTAGRLELLTTPRGNGPGSTAGEDFAIRFGYDRLDRVVSQTRVQVAPVAKTLREQYCYDLAGDLRSITKPKAGTADVTCSPYADKPYTTKLDYDDAHRIIRQTDPEGRVRSQSYDANGNIETVTDEQQLPEPERRFYNQRDQLVRVSEPFTDTRKLFTEYQYDPAGNRVREINPRSFNASGSSFSDFITTHHYDPNDQLIKTDLPDDGAGATAAAYVHRAYDRNGSRSMVSLPVEKALASDLTADEKTTLQHWDPGWVQEADHPSPTRVTYEYTAEGWQSKRTAHRRDGTTRTTDWFYFADGMVKEKKGRDDHRTLYSYDENNNLLTADTDNGVEDVAERPMQIVARWDGFDRLTKTRERKTGETNWRVSDYVLDDNDNIAQRTDNRVEDPAGTMIERGRIHDFTHNLADELVTHLDHGKDSAGTATGDNREITTTYTPTGWLKSRTIKRLQNGSFAQRQRSDWTHFLNGDVKTLETRNGSDVIKESHVIDYLDGERYVNGHRVKDTFKLDGPDPSKRCKSATCVKSYSYDARDRVTDEILKREDNTTQTTHYDLTPASSLAKITVDGQVKTSFDYKGTQLQYQYDGAGQLVRRFFYDAAENLDCVTTAAGSRSDCDNWPNSRTNLVERHRYDDLDRLKLSRKWDPADAAKKDESNYVYDALDRPVVQTETHDAAEERKTVFTYLGLTDRVSRERKTSAADANYVATTKEYSYDADGNRIALTREKDGSPQREFSYGYDVHGNVSLLLDDAGSARAAYGYQAYGDPDPDITAERDGDDPTQPTSATEPLNPYRYSAKRLDTGNGTLDMGARRYGPNIASFLQQDMFEDALGDLELSQDPLTANRYSLAGGNPVSFIETDGHIPAFDSPTAARKFSRARARAGSSGSSSATQSAGRGSGASSSSSGVSTPAGRRTNAPGYGNSPYERIGRLFGGDPGQLHKTKQKIAGFTCGLGEAIFSLLGSAACEVQNHEEDEAFRGGHETGYATGSLAGILTPSGKGGAAARLASKTGSFARQARLYVKSRGLTAGRLRTAGEAQSRVAGYTKAGLAFTKHAAGQRGPSAFPPLAGGTAQKNATGQQVLREILADPRDVSRGITYLEIFDSAGRGARFYARGTHRGDFITFLD